MVIRVEEGDCRDVLATLEADSIDACVTDPPYHLTSIVKRFGATSLGDDTRTSERSREGSDSYARMARGFMGKTWDGGSVAFDPDTWRAVLRVLKPGAHLLAFGGTRTSHRMVCAIEDAGFEIRDTLCWLYGSGFPKSRNVGDGWGTALKPAHEPIILARKPFRGTVAANVLAHGTGAINVDACRIPAADGYIENCVTQGINTAQTSYAPAVHRRPFEPAALGRWPANVVHDGSDEVQAAFAAFGERRGGFGTESRAEGTGIYGQFSGDTKGRSVGFGDTGSASRFFYSAKADSADRADSRHPTVKPVDLMRWLVRLITPSGGIVLDPFAGSGTTGEAAMLEKCDAILIEADAKHAADIRHRIDRWSGLDAPLFAGSTP